MNVMIISAEKGRGKTSFIREYAARMVERGRSVGGITSPAVFENDQRIGYDLIDLRLSTRRLLARVGGSSDTLPTVGTYSFDTVAVTEGNAAIISAVRDGLDIVAVDEVGPLEFRGGGWAPGVEFALRELRAQQELIIAVRPSLAGSLADRFPSSAWESARRVSPPGPVPERE